MVSATLCIPITLTHHSIIRSERHVWWSCRRSFVNLDQLINKKLCRLSMDRVYLAEIMWLSYITLDFPFTFFDFIFHPLRVCSQLSSLYVLDGRSFVNTLYAILYEQWFVSNFTSYVEFMWEWQGITYFCQFLFILKFLLDFFFHLLIKLERLTEQCRKNINVLLYGPKAINLYLPTQIEA